MFRVLVVDDEQPIRGMVGMLLRHHGLTVVDADCAASGIARLGEEPFDAVITDLRMETPLAGFEVVKAAALVTPRPVIVILTAFPVPASDWKSAGADALITKGQRISALVQDLQTLLNRRARSTTPSK